MADARPRAGRALGNEAAIDDFTRAVQLRPRDPAAIERGQAYLSEKDYLSAMADGSAAATIDPNLSAAYDLRGMAVRERGDPRKALEENALAMPDFTQVIAFQPRLAQGYYAWADAERAAGDLASVEKDDLRARILDGRYNWNTRNPFEHQALSLYWPHVKSLYIGSLRHRISSPSSNFVFWKGGVAHDSSKSLWGSSTGGCEHYGV